ncbi:MAG TPA: hypothetical protein VN634_14385 [Candidatus Limnocylindrales bacterium]|nr:hypothetical protein [Candidatus Limnocylindrales bacterium]
MLFPAAFLTIEASHRPSAAGANRRIALGALAITLLTSSPAPAFFQQTKLEGPIGTDIGGVWVSVQNVMPEFRISYPKPANGKAVPFTVEPIPEELAAVMGPKLAGVSVVSCDHSTFCAENGIVTGDVVIRINSADITDVASFEKAVENLPPQILLSIRRPALRMVTARLLKIKYTNQGKETQEGSEQQEDLDVQVLDVALPFDAAIESSRQKHTPFEPSAADLETIKAKWSSFPLSNPLRYMTGEHRFVAKSNFDQSLEADKLLANAKYALIMSMEGNPVQGGGKVIDVYGIESLSEKSMEGAYVSVTMASAPFPINIEFKGRFKMQRLADWSDEDDKLRMKNAANRKPAEDLSKFKLDPDVPPSAKKPADAK